MPRQYTPYRILASFSLTFLLALIICSSAAPLQAQNNPPFRVYLAFEDGPTDEYTPQILDILSQYNAHATFFVNGYQVPGHDAVMQRIISEGHAIANHLWEEPGLYSGATDDDVRASYFRTEEAIRASLGSLVSIYDAQVKLFRQPGGSARPFPETPGLNVITYNWNVQSDDCGWTLDPNSPLSHDEQSLANMLNIPASIGEHYNTYDMGDGAIIALHDINRVTPRILPILLAELQAAGATFEKLPRSWDSVGTMPVILGDLPPQTEGQPGATMRGILRDYAWVRSQPVEGSPLVIDSLAPNTEVLVTGRYGQTDLYTPAWYQVSVNGQTGWMYFVNLRVLGSIPSLPVITPE